jgi:hypothetical protein
MGYETPRTLFTGSLASQPTRSFLFLSRHSLRGRRKEFVTKVEVGGWRLQTS